LEEKHWKIRNSFLEFDIKDHGKITIPSLPPRMSESPSKTEWIKTGIGEDNDAVYEKYGLPLVIKKK
jgi:crotonobetainyl-CoA:carnitine CoA-transferase CaiB-like acyl-CoA transferase